MTSLILLPALSGLLLVLSFPQFDLGLLAWWALVPLLLAIRNKSWKTGFGQGFLAGLIYYAGTLSWVVISMHLYGMVPLPVSYLVMLLLAAYCALYVGVFAALLQAFRSEGARYLLWTAPALWVSLELLRTYLFSGFPWALLGYSQYQNLPVIQIADMTGVYGVSFLVVLVNVLLAAFVQVNFFKVATTETRLQFPWIQAAVCLLLISGALTYGYWRLSPHAHFFSEHPLRIGLVQANIDQARKWDAVFRQETIDRYKRLTAQAAKGTDLVIWPEAATPFLFEVEAGYQEELLRFVREQGVSLLFGSPATAIENSTNQLRLFNSAFLVSADGRILDRYDKIHLVPFGEYVPLKNILSFLDKMVVGIGDFLPGNGPAVLQGPGGQFGVVICFEVIFPDLVRRFVAQGADYMITITNDAWFGRSSAPHQHFGMVVFRAVENRVYFARAANTGISGFIDPYGRVLRKSEIFTEAVLTGEIRTGGPRTFYTAYGDLFAGACVILTLLAPAFARRPERVREPLRAGHNLGRDHAR